MRETGIVTLFAVRKICSGRKELSCGKRCMVLVGPLGRQGHIAGTAVVGLRTVIGKKEMEKMGF